MDMAQVANDLPRFGVDMPTLISPHGSDSSLDGLQEEKAKLENISLLPRSKTSSHRSSSLNPNTASGRLNKFVRRLHEMLVAEREGGVVEWRRGLLILHSIDNFSTKILPKYFNTRNFKTFRRQLNYYGFLHVRSFSASSSATTALWVNQELADHGSDCISSVLRLKRVEPNEASKTPEGRRVRKNEAVSSVEVEGLGALLAGYTDAAEDIHMKSSGCDMPIKTKSTADACDAPMKSSIPTGCDLPMKSSSGGVAPVKSSSGTLHINPVPMFVHFNHQESASASPSNITFAPYHLQVTAPRCTYNASYEHVAPVTPPAPPQMECIFTHQHESSDPLIGQAAGLLLSLSHASD